MKRGDKRFEVRRDDRGFQKGDHVALLRYHPKTEPADRPDYVKENSNWSVHESEAARLDFEIAYILTGGQFGIEPGYVVLGLKEIVNAPSK